MEGQYSATAERLTQLCGQLSTSSVEQEELQTMARSLGLSPLGSKADLCQRLTARLAQNLPASPTDFYKDLSTTIHASVEHKRRRDEEAQDLPPAQRPRVETFVDFIALLPQEIGYEVLQWEPQSTLSRLASVNRQYYERVKQERERRLAEFCRDYASREECLQQAWFDAVKQRNVAAVKDALYYIPPNTRDAAGRTALMYAIDCPEEESEESATPTYLKILQILLDSGEDINATDNSGKSVLEHAIPLYDYVCEDRISILLKRGVRKGLDQVLYAAIKTATDIEEAEPFIQSLLDAGANVNAQHERGMTPLMAAADNYDIIPFLLQHGANPNIQNVFGDTALLYEAGFHGDIQDITEALLESPLTDVNLANFVGVTPLMNAVEMADPELAQTLLDHGADVNMAETRYGNTAFHYAVLSYVGEQVAWKKSIAQPMQFPGVPPAFRVLQDMHKVRLEGIVNVIHKLINAPGLDINAQNKEGLTAIAMAAKEECDECFKLLYDAGADPSIPDNTGMSAYDYLAQTQAKSME